MRKKVGRFFLFLGSILLCSSLALFLYNQRESSIAGQQAQATVEAMQLHFSKDAEELQPFLSADKMPVMTVDGYDYIGLLTIPTLAKRLPVMAEWDYYRLKLAPCRQFGSTSDNNLVIAAHNYPSHFGELSTLLAGDAVSFTDVEGKLYHYTVAAVNNLKPTDVTKVQQSDFDLTLYTCTSSGQARTAVFCNLSSETE